MQAGRTAGGDPSRGGNVDLAGRDPCAACAGGTTRRTTQAREELVGADACRWRAAWRGATRTRASRSTTSSRSRRSGCSRPSTASTSTARCKFATFAVPTIAGEIKRHFRDRGWMLRVPRDVQELNARLTRTRETLTRDLGRSPTVEELARRLAGDRRPGRRGAQRRRGLPHDVARRAAGRRRSAPLEAIGDDDQGFERTEQRLMLRRGFDELAPREREILRLRFFEGLTQREIADEVGISQMHVSRLIRRSVDALRDTIVAPHGDRRVIGRRAGEDTSRVPDAEPAEEADRSDEEQERLNRAADRAAQRAARRHAGRAGPLRASCSPCRSSSASRASTPSSATSTWSRCSPRRRRPRSSSRRSAYHRIAFQRAREAAHHPAGHAPVRRAASWPLAVAMNGAVLLVTDVLFQTTTVDRRRGGVARALRLAVVRNRPIGGDGSDERTRGDPRHRRHARRLQLPAHDRVVPRAAPARPARRDLAHPPPHRHGRRPARGVAVRRRGGGASWARTSAPPRRRSTWRSSTRSSRCTAPAS